MVPRPPSKSPANLFLVGFMGTGKTAVGRLLAHRAGRSFVDLDERIVQRTGLAIDEIFRSLGEPFFRHLEHRMLEETCREGGQVIAAGGGTVVDPRNRELMRASGVVVCLTAKPETIRGRVAGDTPRPLLTPRREAGGERVLEELLGRREVFYREADLTVATDELDPGAVARAVWEWMHERA